MDPSLFAAIGFVILLVGAVWLNLKLKAWSEGRQRAKLSAKAEVARTKLSELEARRKALLAKYREAKSTLAHMPGLQDELDKIALDFAPVHRQIERYRKDLRAWEQLLCDEEKVKRGTAVRWVSEIEHVIRQEDIAAAQEATRRQTEQTQ